MSIECILPPIHIKDPKLDNASAVCLIIKLSLKVISKIFKNARFTTTYASYKFLLALDIVIIDA